MTNFLRLKRKTLPMLIVQLVVFALCLTFLPGAASASPATVSNPADTKAKAGCDAFEVATQIQGGKNDGKWWCKPKQAGGNGGNGATGGNPAAPGTSGCKGNEFFGLIPWWQYLPNDDFDDNCNIVHFDVIHGSDVPLVLLAVVDDLLRIAALVAIAFVIYGAVKYTASQGDPESVAKAQSTVVNALIGLAVAMVAVAFVSFISNQLGG